MRKFNNRSSVGNKVSFFDAQSMFEGKRIESKNLKEKCIEEQVKTRKDLDKVEIQMGIQKVRDQEFINMIRNIRELDFVSPVVFPMMYGEKKIENE